MSRAEVQTPSGHLAQQSQPCVHGGVSSDAWPTGALDAPSPGVDVHAVLGVPRPKRPSERSEEEATEGSDVDDVSDSDDDTEEWQEGEYLLMDDPEDETRRQEETRMLSERASHARRSLLPIFSACCEAYGRWIKENTATVSEDEMSSRRKQLHLYKKVAELYGSDAGWEGLTHAQRVNRNAKAHATSQEAKLLGPPPPSVTEASVADSQN